MLVLLLEHWTNSKWLLFCSRRISLWRLLAPHNTHAALELDCVAHDCLQYDQIICHHDCLDSERHISILCHSHMFHCLLLHFPHANLAGELFVSVQSNIHTDPWGPRLWRPGCHKFPYIRGLYDLDYAGTYEPPYSYPVGCLWASHIWKVVLWWQGKTIQECVVWGLRHLFHEALQRRKEIRLSLPVCIHANRTLRGKFQRRRRHDWQNP